MKTPTRIAALLLLIVTQAQALMAQSRQAGDTLQIVRTSGAIKIDGTLSDEGWEGVKPVTTWYEANPGDNTPPKVRNVGTARLRRSVPVRGVRVRRSESRTRFARRIRTGTTPAAASMTSAASSSTRATAGAPPKLFVVTPRNIQADSIIDDASGEDMSPDFFWESATRITDARVDPRDADSVHVAPL